MQAEGAEDLLQGFKVGVDVERRKKGSVGAVPARRPERALRPAGVQQRSAGASAVVRFFISFGSAALNAEIAGGFNAAGVLILEGCGMTENAAGRRSTSCTPTKIGTVGLALPGSEIMIGPDDEGVMLRGPHSWPATQPPGGDQDADRGGLAAQTGDKGSLDAEGFLHHHQPDGDLFKTSGGKSTSPRRRSGQVQGAVPYASQFPGLRNGASYVVAPDHPRPGRDGGLGLG